MSGSPSVWRSSWNGALVLAGLALGVFSLSPLIALVPAYLRDPNYSHGMLVPLAVIMLIWRSRSRVFSTEHRPCPAGLVPLALGCGLVTFGHWYNTALQPGYLGHVFLRGTGLIISIWSVVWVLAGSRRTRLLAPALGLLVFAVPMPESFLLPVTAFLQRLVAVGSTGLLRGMGMEVFRDGNLLHLHSAVLGVAEACSGIRSLMAFFATAATCAAFLRLGLRRTLVLFILTPVAAVGTNIIRIIITSYLVSNWGDSCLEGTLHDALGLVTVLLGGGIIFAGARFLSRGVPDPLPPASPPRIPQPRARLWVGPLATSTLLLSATAGMLFVSHHYRHMAPPKVVHPVTSLPLAAFPLTVGPYRCTYETKMLPGEVEMLRPVDHFVRGYTDEAGNSLTFTVLYWPPEPTHPGSATAPRFPHSPSNCMPGAGWERVSAFDNISTYTWLPDTPVFTWLFRKTGRDHIVIYWQAPDHDELRLFSPKNSLERLRLLIRSWNEIPSGILPQTYGVKIETDIKNQSAEAKTMVLDFARQVVTLLPRHGIGSAPPTP